MGADPKLHDFAVNKDQDEEKKKQSKEEKEEAERPKNAISLLTGGDIKMGKSGSSVTASSQYIGVGPLVVPATRGEQKAVSGDVAIRFYIDNEDPSLDEEFVVVLPYKLAEALGLLGGNAATLDEWTKFQDERAKRQAEADAKKVIYPGSLTGIAAAPAQTQPSKMASTTAKPTTKTS